jgi:hypothetical protein
MERETAGLLLRNARIPGGMIDFVRAMIRLEGSDFDVCYFLDHPEKWAREYACWFNANLPTDPASADFARWQEALS